MKEFLTSDPSLVIQSCLVIVLNDMTIWINIVDLKEDADDFFEALNKPACHTWTLDCFELFSSYVLKITRNKVPWQKVSHMF